MPRSASARSNSRIARLGPPSRSDTDGITCRTFNRSPARTCPVLHRAIGDGLSSAISDQGFVAGIAAVMREPARRTVGLELRLRRQPSQWLRRPPPALWNERRAYRE